MVWWKCFCKVLVGLFFLASEIFQLSMSAVDSRRNPCEPGEFYEDFLGICLSCQKYCVGREDCRSVCTIQTSMSTSRPPTQPRISSSPTLTTVSPVTHPASVGTSTLGDFLPNNPTVLSSGGDNAFSSNPSYLELSAELVFGVFFSLLLLVIMFKYFIKYRKTLKMPSVCCFFTRESTQNADPEDGRFLSPPLEAPPTENEPSSRQPNSTGYALVQVIEDSMEMGASGNADRNRPGPPGLRSPLRLDVRTSGPSIPANPPSGFRSKSGFVDVEAPFQSARMQYSELLERENLQGAVPTDQRPKRKKTPEIYRKVTDGSHEHHECTTGASLFTPPGSMRDDIQMNRNSGHGD